MTHRGAVGFAMSLLSPLVNCKPLRRLAGRGPHPMFQPKAQSTARWS